VAWSSPGKGGRKVLSNEHGEENSMGGKTDRAKGRVKEGVGGLTDNKRLKGKGRADSATGTAKKKAGRAADKVKRTLD
jgi:uncharacterized protein YjbJ (UPF0337 family)